jgi:transcriptional regulator with GAF, ATPase, and Fis domain
MTRASETLEEPPEKQGQTEPARPGVVVVLCCGAPTLKALPLDGARITLGRDRLEPAGLVDAWQSREHADIAFDGARWTITDRASRNGTFVDGVRVNDATIAEAPSVVRVGRTLLLLVRDVRRFEGAAVSVDAMVIGPTSKLALDRVAYAAKTGEGLLINGESGTGKEAAAAAFHAASPHAQGPFVPVNCAAIPEGLAERLLFGAKRGAFTGASSDAGGYVAGAEGGVLFLDEIGELEPDVQPKLLRVLESKEILALGATRPRRVNVAFCFATHRDLRAAVAAGQLRADLYYRIAQQQVTLPPLRARREEIPFLVVRELARIGATTSEDGRFVEACMTRPWPGNVRELIQETRRAGHEALAAKETEVRVDHLAMNAGRSFEGREEPIATTTTPSNPGGASSAAPPTKEAIGAIFAAHGGNIAATARALGLHRAQVYRLLRRFGLVADK